MEKELRRAEWEVECERTCGGGCLGPWRDGVVATADVDADRAGQDVEVEMMELADVGDDVDRARYDCGGGGDRAVGSVYCEPGIESSSVSSGRDGQS